MKYKDIEILNFRGIKELKLRNCGNINIILGKNNSSKTSILESIFVLSGSLNPEIILSINLFRNLRFNEQEDFRLIFNGLNYEKNVKLSALGYFEDTRELEIRPASTDKIEQSTIPDISPDTLYRMSGNSNFSESSINQLVFATTFKERHQKLKSSTSTLYFVNGEFGTERKTTKDVYNNRAVFVTQSLVLSQNLEKELEDLIVNKQHLLIVDVLKEIDSSIIGLSLGHNKMIYVDIGISRLIPINLLGDGIRRMLSIILSIFNAKSGIVLIDEIENGLHYLALKSLWKSVILAAELCDVQLFTTTHNHETIKYIQECLTESDFTRYQGTVKTFTIRKLENETHKSYVYDFDQFSNAIENHIELR